MSKINKQRKTWTVEQKLDYAKLMVHENYTNSQIQEISGAGKSAVARWKKQYIDELGGKTPDGKRALTAQQQEIQDLRKQLWRAKRDNEILKRLLPFLFKKTKN